LQFYQIFLGDEDHLGDMDFKVTGTRDGITATQMDIKVEGCHMRFLPRHLIRQRVGRLHILGQNEGSYAVNRVQK
jgi:polyribonucleotide nucleotidyltransferase